MAYKNGEPSSIIATHSSGILLNSKASKRVQNQSFFSPLPLFLTIVHRSFLLLLQMQQNVEPETLHSDLLHRVAKNKT